jgi:transposase
MYIAVVPNRSSPPAILLRESYRQGGKVCSRTLANLSRLSPRQVEAMRRVLRGEALVAPETLVEKVRDRAHGAVDAVRQTMRRLGFESLIGAKRSRERDIIMALVAARIVAPDTKLATTRWWHTTTLPDDLGVSDASEDDAYEAMDWLLERQGSIEKKLAARHLKQGGLVLYDLSSSYFEGTTCPLAKLGYNRDGKKGKLQVNYGLLTDARGCPVAVSVFEGNTADPKTLLPAVEKVRQDFGMDELVLVGDRGMISQRQIDSLSKESGVAWITALKTTQIRKLMASGALQLGLFDDRNLFAVEHPDFPGERLIACKNPELAKLRAHKRGSMLAATSKELDKVRGMVERGRLQGKGRIGVRIGKVIDKYKMAKHFILEVTDMSFSFQLRLEQIEQEAALDGIYIVRTSLPVSRASDEDAVRNYKKLANVERAFRSMKTIDLHVRPIHHRLASRVRAHIFLCMLAHYIEWHMREAWRPLLFSDEDQDAKEKRDPVVPAKRSAAALRKVRTRTLDDGTPAHSFGTLLTELGTITRSTCRPAHADSDEDSFELLTTPTAKQERAFDLLKTIAV